MTLNHFCLRHKGTAFFRLKLKKKGTKASVRNSVSSTHKMRVDSSLGNIFFIHPFTDPPKNYSTATL